MTTKTQWVEVEACTLATVERPLRADEFDDVFAHHLTMGENHTATGTIAGSSATLEFTGGRAVERWLLDLTARESQCCSFFSFGVAREGDQVRLSITVPPAHVDVLQALVGRAYEVAAATL